MGVELQENRSGVIQQTLSPAAVGAATTSEQTFTVRGLKPSDAVFVVKPTHTTGVMPVHARVSANDTLAVCFNNPTAGSLTPPAEPYLIYWFRGEALAKSVQV